MTLGAAYIAFEEAQEMSPNVPLFVYRANVEALADRRMGEPVYNDSIEHAAIILQNILSHARSSVKILTGELNRDAYARRAIVEEAKRFVEDGSHTLQILFENEKLDPNEMEYQHPFLQAIADNDRVQLRHVPRNLQATYDFHFVLMDSDGYRFEPDKAKFGAVAAFGDRTGGENLEKLFTILWGKSKPVQYAARA